MTEREKLDLSVYKASKSVVGYSAKWRSVRFGEPAAFEVFFDKK